MPVGRAEAAPRAGVAQAVGGVWSAAPHRVVRTCHHHAHPHPVGRCLSLLLHTQTVKEAKKQEAAAAAAVMQQDIDDMRAHLREISTQKREYEERLVEVNALVRKYKLASKKLHKQVGRWVAAE